LVVSVFLILVSSAVFGGDEQHELHQGLVVKPRWETWTPPNTGGETKMSNTRVAPFGFTTSVWWGLRCSSWFHHQCLVGSVLVILVSPPVFGGIRVAHLGFNTSVYEQDGPHQALVMKPG
jgi:hypothetical protein